MRKRLVLLAAVLAAVPAAPASAADDRVIAAGVTIRGIAVGGQTVDQAAAAVGGMLAPHLGRDIVVRIGGTTRRLTVERARFAFDPVLTAKRAFHAGAAANGQPVDVAPAVRHSRLAVRSWAWRTRKGVTRAARNATIDITVRRLRRRAGRNGITIDHRALAESVDKALDDTASPRAFRHPTVPLAPKVGLGDLARVYGTVVTIDRANFKLRLFKRLKFSRSYGIAVGMAGLDTPSGRYAIHNKSVNPAWHVPNSAWAGSLAGSTIPGGAPNNPLKARWMGVAASVGIHGTAEEWSIGTRASHGCIRMRVRDVIDLYPRVPLGTPVLIR
jgi:L,D-transpeptidase catalytic domain